MDRSKGLIRGWGSVTLALYFLAILAGILPSTASAATEHLFDPCLSLTGNTETGPLDECPDPGSSHPAQPFFQPDGTATDRFGDIYVANYNGSAGHGNIMAFNPAGEFLMEFSDPNGPTSLAVDSECNVYTVDFGGPEKIGPENTVSKYSLSDCPPSPATTASAPATVLTGGPTYARAVAVDPANDHLFTTAVSGENPADQEILEFGPGGAGPPTRISLAATGAAPFEFKGIDVWGKTGDIYLAGRDGGIIPGGPGTVYVVSPSGALVDKFSGNETPAGSFSSFFPYIAVDQSNGDVYVVDVTGGEVVDQFQLSSGHYRYVGQLTHSFRGRGGISDVAVDAPMEGDTTYSSPHPGYVFVTSSTQLGLGHLYAFRPKTIGAPEVTSGVAEVGAEEASLEAKVNPNGLPTTFRFEYGTSNCELGGCISVPPGGRSAGEGGAFIPFSEVISGLLPGTTYHFRVVAENAETSGAPVSTPDQTFTTFGSLNGLPDGRAYELVTPGDTNGLRPTSGPTNTAPYSLVETPFAREDGDAVVYLTLSGGFPPGGGNGAAEAFEAVRDAGSGWHSRSFSPSGQQAVFPFYGGSSSDYGASLWEIPAYGGSLDIGGPGSEAVTYLRNQLGEFELVGRGELADDPGAVARWLSTDGRRVIFTNQRTPDPREPLTQNAPAQGTTAVYEQTVGASTKLVSLFPGEVTPSPTESAAFKGANRSGSAVVFSASVIVGPVTREQILFERIGGVRTVQVSPGTALFSGVSEDGRKVFYEVTSGPEAGLWEFDAETESRAQLTPDGESVFVNVSRDGSRAYFSSPVLLDEGKGIVGEHNLYMWNGGGPHFIATLDPADFAGGVNLSNWSRFDAANELGVAAVNGAPNIDPSRTNHTGEVFLFQSHANLTPPYEASGHSEIYRYAAGSESLVCVSCNPTGKAASTAAELVRDIELEHFAGPTTTTSRIPNMNEDGTRVIFQTREALSPEDHDAFADVYEWHEGTVSLISAGGSDADEDLYGMTPNASDIFFISSEILLPEDTETTPSIYDARVGGGFPQAADQVPCSGEACRREPASPPAAAAPNSEDFNGSGNRHRSGKAKKCRKGTHRVKRHGKQQCVRNSSKRSHHARHSGRGGSHKKGKSR